MFQEFRTIFQHFPVITLNDIRIAFPNFDSKNLINWQKKKYLIKLRNGYYQLTEFNSGENNLFLIANHLYTPSYLSLETALNFHGIIPEAVYTIQSVTTLKTMSFHNSIGTFQYRSIKTSLFFGYQLLQGDSRKSFRMASPEKAILDFLYFRHDIKDAIQFSALRWNAERLKALNFSILMNYVSFYNSPTLLNKIKWIKPYIDAQYS